MILLYMINLRLIEIYIKYYIYLIIILSYVIDLKRKNIKSLNDFKLFCL
jgi:hypothetical protein